MRAPLLAAALLACRAGAAGERHEEAAAPRFVATTFSGSGFASPSSTMLVATSADGELFTNIAAGRHNNASSAPLYSMPGGVRDPSLLRWRGRWFVVLSFAQNKSSSLFLASSADLRHWEPAGGGGRGLLLAPLSRDNFVDVPQLIVGKDGEPARHRRPGWSGTVGRDPPTQRHCDAPQRVGRRCELVRPSAAAGYAGRGARARQ